MTEIKVHSQDLLAVLRERRDDVWADQETTRQRYHEKYKRFIQSAAAGLEQAHKAALAGDLSHYKIFNDRIEVPVDGYPKEPKFSTEGLDRLIAALEITQESVICIDHEELADFFG